MADKRDSLSDAGVGARRQNRRSGEIWLEFEKEVRVYQTIIGRIKIKFQPGFPYSVVKFAVLLVAREFADSPPAILTRCRARVSEVGEPGRRPDDPESARCKECTQDDRERADGETPS